MRADRLVATLLFLQQRGRATAREVADELEVSVPTARRDLAALATAGVPVYPQPGRGGGWQLVGGARTDLSGLTGPETRALFLLTGPGARVDAEAKAALRKLVRALPATFRAEAEVAAVATVVDPTRWGEPSAPRPPVVGALQAAVVRRRRVRLGYVHRSGERTERVVDPWGLVDKDDVWYLVAGTEQGRRTFRVDRVDAVEELDETFARPPDLDLGRVWEEVVGEVEALRARTWATLTIETRWVWVLRDRFGRHCHVEAEVPGGRSRVRVAAPTALDLARDLAGWGGAVDVLDPPEVRAHLGRLGRELVERYAEGG